MRNGRRGLWWLVLFALWPTVAAAQISPTYTFSNGTVIDAAQVNANFALLQNALNRTGGTMTGTLTTRNVLPDSNAARDLGSAIAQWNNAWINTLTLTTLTCTGCVDATQLAATAVTGASYGSSSAFPTFTVDADGRQSAAPTVTNAGLLARVGSTETISGAWTFSGTTPAVPCLAYNATTWNGNTGAPCMDALRDEIEGIITGAGFAPIGAQYWTGAADGTLTSEKNLGALATAFVINTAGVPSAYAGASCTNQLVSAVSAVGGLTCHTIASADLAASLALTTPNIGTATATSVNKYVFNQPSNIATLFIHDTKTLEVTDDATLSGTNTGDVSLAGSPNYLTISGQTITRNLINLGTHVTGDLDTGHLNGGSGADSTHYWRGDGVWETPFNDPRYLALERDVLELRQLVDALLRRTPR